MKKKNDWCYILHPFVGFFPFFNPTNFEPLRVLIALPEFSFFMLSSHEYTYTQTHTLTHHKRENKKAKGARKKKNQVEAYQRTQAITKKKL